MSSEDSTRGHLAQYLNDAENLIHIIMYDDFDKQIDLLKKYGPSTKEYVRQIAATVQHIRQLQFLCISSSWSKTEKNHVCHYLNEEKRKEFLHFHSSFLKICRCNLIPIGWHCHPSMV